jgi:hypothetical protein
MLLLGSDGKSITMIHNFKWKRTPHRALLQGSFDLTVAPARNLQAAAISISCSLTSSLHDT